MITTFLIFCMVIFTILAFMWSHNTGFNIFIKALFVTMLVWSAILYFRMPDEAVEILSNHNFFR